MDENANWVLEGPVVWAVGSVAVIAHLSLIAVTLRDYKNVCTISSVYALLIAITGILVTLTHEFRFFIRFVNPIDYHWSLEEIRKFANGKFYLSGVPKKTCLCPRKKIDLSKKEPHIWVQHNNTNNFRELF